MASRDAKKTVATSQVPATTSAARALTAALEKTDRLKELYDKKHAAANDTLNAYRIALDELMQLVRPPCKAAIAIFNEFSLLKIAEPIAIHFTKDGTAVVLNCLLRDASGTEPDEDFEGDDVAKICSVLAKYMDIAFEEAGLPLKLRRLQVPSSYYMV